MQLSKKQVGYWLETMEKPGVRANINGAYIDIFENNTVVVTTDGYVLVALQADALKDHVGKFIPRDNIIKWHKLANTRDMLDDQLLIQMASTEDITYPVWQKIVANLTPQPTLKIGFNARYAFTMFQIANEHLTWTLNGHNQAMTAQNTSSDKFVIMPIKI